MTPAGRRRILLGFSLSFLGLVGAAGLLVAFLLQSAPGQRHVLRTVLQVVDRRIQGSLSVEEIRSGGLLRGFILTGVRLRDAEGAPFLEVDSVRVAYTLRGLPSRTLQLEPVAIWAPRVVVETLPGDSLTNVQRIFSGPSEAPEGAGGPPPLDLRMARVRIQDGRLELRSPTAVSIYDGIEAQIQDAELLSRREPGLRIRFDALSGRVQQAGLGEAPFTLDHFEGTLEVVEGRVEIEADDLQLGGSRLEGILALAWVDAPTLSLDAEVHRLRGEDLRWLDARIPALEGGFLVRAEGPLEALTWEVDALELVGDDTRLTGRFGVTLGETPTFSGVALETQFDLAFLEPWLEDPLPMAGQIRGELRAEGPFRALEMSGRFSLEDRARGIPASEVSLNGRLNLEEMTTPGLTLRADPLRMATLRIVGVEAQGTGSAELRVVGGLGTGVTLSGRVTHALQGELTSRVALEGFASRERMELAATLSPLSFDGLGGALGQELPIVGTIAGTLQLVGPYEAVRMTGVVSPLSSSGEETEESLRLEAVVDLRDPTRSLALEAETEGLDLSRLVRAAPEGSWVSGRLALEARGLVASSPEQLDGWLDLDLGLSRLGALQINELRARADAEEGRLYLRELSLRSNVGEVEGEGELALTREVAPGVTTLHWRLPSIRSLRAFLPEESPFYPQSGEASGRFELFGTAAELELNFLVQGALLELAQGLAERVSLQGTTRLQEGTLAEIEAVAILEAPEWERFSFRRGVLDAAGSLKALQLALDLAGNSGEQYRLSGLLETEQQAFRLETLELGLDQEVWTLRAPTQLSWAEGVYRVEPLELHRPPMRMALAGFFDPSGEVDLRVESVGVDVSQVARLLQLEATPEGMLDLSFTLRGPSQSPRAEGQFLLFEAGFGETRFSRIAGEIQAADQMANLSLNADQGGRLALRAVGQYPLDLALGTVEARFPALPVSLDLTVMELSAQTLLSPIEALEDVRGTLSGEIQVRGEPEALLPFGSLRLVDGSFALPEIGLVPEQIQATFTLTRDRVLEVVAEARSGGSLRLTGEVALSDLLNPGLNLRLEADRMQAVARRDIDARVSGIVDLTGSYMRPRVTGNIRVDQANLYLEEFARTAEVVDLSDPAFRDVVDTTLAAARPILRAASNPFLENLRVDADLSMQRDVWLRSREMNVEIGGDLVVTFDRSRREVLLVGTVAAVRGSYNAFGKAFQVRGGTVDFVGTPGINPTLSVEAVHRLRQPGGEPLDIVAQLEGTLLGLRISLRSDASVAISEADLISYLVFGRPSYALASAESRMLGDAAISAGIGAATGQISTLVGQRIGLDYFTITQAQDAGPGVAAVTGQGLADTQVELGQYVFDDVFLALVLRPLRGIGGSQAQIPGARVEWRLTDRWTFNAYVEDRFGREGIYSFGDGGLRVNRIFGLELFREWGY